MLATSYGLSASVCLLVAVSFLTTRADNPLCARILGVNYLLYALQSLLGAVVFSGLFPEAGFLRAIGAMMLGPALYAYYLSALRPKALQTPRKWLHLIPPGLMIFVLISGYWRIVDLLIIASFTGYWLAVVRHLLNARVHQANNFPGARRWLWLLAVVMLTGLVVEMGITVEIIAGTPAVDSTSLKLGGGLFFIFHCAALLLVLSRARLMEWMHELKPWPTGTQWASAELRATFDRWQQLVGERKLYRSEHTMTLARAARLMGVPARQLSRAINTCYGASFSRHMNDLRVDLAKTLLKQTPMPVTEVYLEAGFATKSHFHREFVRVTGQSPSSYRSAAPNLGSTGGPPA